MVHQIGGQDENLSPSFSYQFFHISKPPVEMTILKGVPRVLSPELLCALARMGHGDFLVLADANFPAECIAKTTTLGHCIRCDGHSVPVILSAILKLMPLDTYSPPAAVMGVTPQDAGKVSTPIWKEYSDIIEKCDGRRIDLEQIERFAFYEKSKSAFCIIQTGESSLYGNLILTKGVLKADE